MKLRLTDLQSGESPGVGGGGEGGNPLYKPYRYVPPQRVGLLCGFGLKTGTHFTHFGLESVMVYVYVCRFILSNDDINFCFM